MFGAGRSEDPLEGLVRAHYEDVWRLCAALVDRDAADDLAQETFMSAARALDAFRADSSARTWLLSIARRRCVDELRARTRRAHRQARLVGEQRAVSARAPAHGAEVRDLIERLEPDRRVAFVLTQLLGLSYAEAAIVCECPVGTIRSRVARARAELISQLDDASRPADTAGR